MNMPVEGAANSDAFWEIFCHPAFVSLARNLLQLKEKVHLDLHIKMIMSTNVGSYPI